MLIQYKWTSSKWKWTADRRLGTAGIDNNIILYFSACCIFVQVSHAIVDKCFELGVNFFDTAEAYSSHGSEKVLGEALKGRRRDAVVATKYGNMLVSDFGSVFDLVQPT